MRCCRRCRIFIVPSSRHLPRNTYYTTFSYKKCRLLHSNVCLSPFLYCLLQSRKLLNLTCLIFCSHNQFVLGTNIQVQSNKEEIKTDSFLQRVCLYFFVIASITFSFKWHNSRLAHIPTQEIQHWNTVVVAQYDGRVILMGKFNHN